VGADRAERAEHDRRREEEVLLAGCLADEAASRVREAAGEGREGALGGGRHGSDLRPGEGGGERQILRGAEPRKGVERARGHAPIGITGRSTERLAELLQRFDR
jgi:hypothetical protein